MLDRKKHRQEIESLKADNRQKDMNRRTSERRGQAGLDFVFLGRDSAIPKQAWMALAAPSVDVCPHRAECPVLDELRKQSEGD